MTTTAAAATTSSPVVSGTTPQPNPPNSSGKAANALASQQIAGNFQRGERSVDELRELIARTTRGPSLASREGPGE